MNKARYPETMANPFELKKIIKRLSLGEEARIETARTVIRQTLSLKGEDPCFKTSFKNVETQVKDWIKENEMGG